VPQFFLSLSVLTHLPPHSESPALQPTRHWLSWQMLVPPVSTGQALSQPPQCCPSVFGSTQTSPQRKRPALHWKVHAPVSQRGEALAGALQALSQSPQWLASLFKSTQDPSQSLRSPQSVAHWPPLQTWPLWQGLSQPPQCC